MKSENRLFFMSTIISKRYGEKWGRFPIEAIPKRRQKKSLIQHLQIYFNKQNTGENQFRWEALTMATQAIIITPFIVSIIMMTGNWIPLWFVATASMFVTFIPSLAGLSGKQIMSVYFINLVISVLTIVTAILYFIITN
jgi:cellulose synthase/poly-beta-1,6-N-acetylglucosamine synthase-like glycosyltransferase